MVLTDKPYYGMRFYMLAPPCSPQDWIQCGMRKLHPARFHINMTTQDRICTCSWSTLVALLMSLTFQTLLLFWFREFGGCRLVVVTFVACSVGVTVNLYRFGTSLFLVSISQSLCSFLFFVISTLFVIEAGTCQPGVREGGEQSAHYLQ